MANSLVSQAGKFDRRVTVVRDGASTRNSRNEQIAGAPETVTRWCSVRPAPGFERFQSGENAATALWRFIFRWSADLVRVTDRLRTEDDQRIWDVKSVNPIGRREGIEVLAAARME